MDWLISQHLWHILTPLSPDKLISPSQMQTPAHRDYPGDELSVPMVSMLNKCLLNEWSGQLSDPQETPTTTGFLGRPQGK